MTIGFKLSKVMCLLLLLMFTNLTSSIFTGLLIPNPQKLVNVL